MQFKTYKKWNDKILNLITPSQDYDLKHQTDYFWKIINDIMVEMQRKSIELNEIRDMLKINYGPSGEITPNLINNKLSTPEMLSKVLNFYKNKENF
jgi:hypothetical protein